MMPQLSIIIIDYNSSRYIKDCLLSITKADFNMEYEVIVVDNASKENHLKEYEQIETKVKTIHSDKNLGFGGGNNLGASHARGQFLWFLNADTLIPDDSINLIFPFLEKNKDIGIVSPVLYNDKEMQQEQPDFYARFQNLTTVLTRSAKPKPQIIDDQYFLVDVVVGASLVIKKPVFEAIGGFDEQIFMFFDDDDLCFRSKKAGFKTAVFLKSHIVHLQGKSIKTNKERKKLYYRSQNYFWQKNYGFWPTLIMTVLRFPYILFSRLR